MTGGIPERKRAFDIFMILLLSPIIIPVLSACALAILIADGRPIFYFSRRRIYQDESLTMVKFRTMRRDAERIANRETVPVTTTRFLNIPITSPLYTSIGRLIERCVLTEMPQLLHVLQGKMTLVGNRPLPENVIKSLREAHPDVERRFQVPGGLTGPSQLVGRDFISDADRIRLEVVYCRLAATSYTVWLDILILFHTVAIALVPSHRFSPDKVLMLMNRATEGSHWRLFGVSLRRRPNV